MIAIPGEEAPADPLADLGAEAILADPGAHFLLAPVRPDGEAAGGLLSETLAAAAEPSLAVADAAADAGADELATQAGLILGITGQQNGHETPPCASSPRGELPAFISHSYALCVGVWRSLGSARSKGEADRPRDGFGVSGGFSRGAASALGCPEKLSIKSRN